MKEKNAIMGSNSKEQDVISDVSNHKEEPLIILEHNYKLVISMILLIVFITIFLLIFIIIPVMKAGSFAAAWPTGGNMQNKIPLFYLSWSLLVIWPFFLLVLFRYGKYFFYNDRLVFAPFVRRAKITIPYTQMYVQCYGRRGVLITKGKPPEWSQPIKRLKVQYFQTLGLGGFTFHDNRLAGLQISKGPWINPSGGPKAIQLLRDKAFSVIDRNN